MFHVFYYRAVGILYCHIPAGWDLIQDPENFCAFFFQINLEFTERIYKKSSLHASEGF